MVRDPSSLLIAFVLPPVLLFLFSLAVSLDVKDVAVGVVLDSDDPVAQSLASAFSATRYLRVTPARHLADVDDQLVSGDLKAIVVIPESFAVRQINPAPEAAIQIITDASNPNTASFVAAYLQGSYQGWLAGQTGAVAAPLIELRQRFWFNMELESRSTIVPGAMAIVMTMIGTLLTALVVSREWERGTMEAMISTPATMGEILISKLVPYFVLGLLTVLFCTFLAVFFLRVELVGSLWALMAISAAFLVPALGQGLLISTVSSNQFVASQLAVISGFLPAFLLSGFLFEIRSMPLLIQWITQVIPARYYVSSLQTVFLAGDIWPLFLRDMGMMIALGLVFFAITRSRSKQKLD